MVVTMLLSVTTGLLLGVAVSRHMPCYSIDLISGEESYENPQSN